MEHKVVALGIDGPNGALFDEWLAEGELLIAAGPGLSPGSGAPDGRLEDLSATLLHLAGADSPVPIDGRSLLSLFQPVEDQ